MNRSRKMPKNNETAKCWEAEAAGRLPRDGAGVLTDAPAGEEEADDEEAEISTEEGALMRWRERSVRSRAVRLSAVLVACVLASGIALLRPVVVLVLAVAA